MVLRLDLRDVLVFGRWDLATQDFFVVAVFLAEQAQGLGIGVLGV